MEVTNGAEFTVNQELLTGAQGQFGNPEEGEHPPMEISYQRNGEETADREDSVFARVKYRVFELVTMPREIVITSVSVQ
jgi:hypothetical protein